jgi:predicted regulator of Ras-like GTPase activity (Roadblock/LC7/MglB family)
MKSVLDRLAGARGVVAAVVLDTEGVVIASAGQPRASSALHALGRRAMKPGEPEVPSLQPARTHAAIVRCEAGTLVVRRMEDATLIVIGSADLDTSLAGAGFHIAVAARVIGVRSSQRSAPLRGDQPSWGF